jgi:hypothetical protein
MGDPASLMAAGALAVDVVSLLLSRLDRRKDADEVRLQLDVPTAMRELAILLDEWAAQTRKTNAAARGWVEAGMPQKRFLWRWRRSRLLRSWRRWRLNRSLPPWERPDPELAWSEWRLDLEIEVQGTPVEAIGPLLWGREHWNVYGLLKLYAPELGGQLIGAATQRARQLDDLKNELRTRASEGSEQVTSFLDELDAAADQLETASQLLNAYVRSNFPIANN